LLALACASGTHIDTIIVEVYRAGGEKIKYMEYKLTNCIIRSVTFGSKGKKFFPTEHVNINFGKIEWAYTVQSRQGGWATGKIAGGWNLEKNARV
jgi:type VI secretion system secreted protein Hcp